MKIIYCTLICDSQKEYFIGLISIRDILFLFKYIIEKAQQKEIIDYYTFIKDIFTSNKKNKVEEITEGDSKKDNNYDILK